MTVTVLPDTEALVISYLETQSSVTALVSNRIYGNLPASPVFPLLRVHRSGGQTDYGHYVDRPVLTFEAYGRFQTEAGQIARTVHAVMVDMPQSHSRGIVTSVRDTFGMGWSPDPSYSPAKPRYLFGLVLTVHP